MRKTGFRGQAASALLILAVLTAIPAAPGQAGWLAPYREPAARLIASAQADLSAWQRLAELCDRFGPRLAGSENLERAIEWVVAEMKKDGLENVRAEKVMVPHWVRGHEWAEITRPARRPLVMLGLGNSVGTGPSGVEADLLVVRSFDELTAKAGEARGKIVLFNVPFTGYGPTVTYRSRGASEAARRGAVGMLLRSVGLPGLRTPHTGALNYSADAPKIPAAAIAFEDADMLQRRILRGESLRVKLYMEARMLPEAESANVVGEIIGREKPEEIVVVGGHLDSWDVGTGAIDDGGGCVATWQALRLMSRLGLRPRRTVRVVLFTNEENGLRGGLGYRDRHAAELANHVLMLESDSGVFRPLGFGFSGSEKARAIVAEIASLLEPISAASVRPGGGGADIGPSVTAGKIPSMSLEVDGGEYFRFHHTPADTVDKVEPRDLARCSAAVAVMAYVVADMPERLK